MWAELSIKFYDHILNNWSFMCILYTWEKIVYAKFQWNCLTSNFGLKPLQELLKGGVADFEVGLRI